MIYFNRNTLFDIINKREKESLGLRNASLEDTLKPKAD